MTAYEQEKQFIALAFIAVLLKGDAAVQEGSATKIMMLAKLLSDFCTVNAPSAIGWREYSDDAKKDIDATINQYIKNRRAKNEIALPHDIDELTKLYTRMQFRKIHRINAALFEMITLERMAEMVMSQIDGEIEDLEGLS